ncbi:LacI family DNA-binding transcriptional regulator [Parasphaerochaeta coccoides]|uniref:Transcriptional regulator, LacI family n=1 Tax=Parasphaerochaeta coccoides (strain ATCC BAA-1237 / DSM 17374 / SPN1) TaxID=760011 RepID=F4GJ24_PARC1|nr:LacI family DNA-binding transcriptional regulator [Parasphaerochaeta coccoides]AEC01319.1 transcriptional regulator, LacI family [Parasphaerochaeta coccoides DSM 17374]
MVSIKDIARIADVSVSTVSRIINNKKGVNLEKQARVLQAIKSTGYVPNKAARDMVMKRTFTVALIIPDTFNIFQRQLFSNIEHHLQKFGYRTVFYFVAMGPDGEDDCFQRVKSERTDGIIMLQEIQLHAFYEYLESNKIPCVITTFEKDEWTSTSIHVSEEEAAHAAVNHLIQLGHRRISLICGKRYSFSLERKRGYRNALEYAGLKYDENLVVYVDSYSVLSGGEGMRELMKRNTPFTAVFAVTDELAIGAMRELKDHGISVPQDVSIVGFDDIEISSFTIPRLTTIRQPLGEMAQTSVAMIHSLITSENHLNVNIAMPSQLIIRESTSTLNGNAQDGT